MTIVLILLALLAVGYALNLVRQARAYEAEARSWARGHDLTLTDETRPIVTIYLRNSRHLRQLGAVGALFIAAAVTAGTGVDLHVPGMVWILCGYVIGSLWAELALAHVPSSGARSASLETRRLRDYLPLPMVVAEVALPLIAGALSIVSFAADPSTRPNNSTNVELFVVGSPEVMRQGAVATGAVAVALMIAVAVGQRLLLRRPQPLCRPEELVIDDAMRSTSIHLVGATGLVVAAMTMAQQLGYLSNLVSGTMQTVLILAAVAAVAASLLIWKVWAHRRWPARRREVIVDERRDPLVPVASGGPAPGSAATDG